jgi:hypothetical protein
MQTAFVLPALYLAHIDVQISLYVLKNITSEPRADIVRMWLSDYILQPPTICVNISSVQYVQTSFVLSLCELYIYIYSYKLRCMRIGVHKDKQFQLKQATQTRSVPRLTFGSASPISPE